MNPKRHDNRIDEDGDMVRGPQRCAITVDMDGGIQLRAGVWHHNIVRTGRTMINGLGALSPYRT
jgi:hypothetical protein